MNSRTQMVMLSTVAIILIALAFAVAGCGTVVTSGVVTGKHDIKPRNGLTGWTREVWQVHVRSASGGQSWFNITKSEYQHVRIGDYWEISS